MCDSGAVSSVCTRTGQSNSRWEAQRRPVLYLSMVLFAIFVVVHVVVHGTVSFIYIYSPIYSERWDLLYISFNEGQLSTDKN